MESTQQLREDILETLQQLEKTQNEIKRFFDDSVAEARQNANLRIFDNPNNPKYSDNLRSTKEQLQRLQNKFVKVKHYFETDQFEDTACEGPLPISSPPAVPFNSPVLAELTHFNSVADFWVEPCREEELDALNILLENFNLQPSGDLKPRDAKKGSYCMASLPPDNFWHRARIIDLIQGTGASIHFVDFGKTASRPLSQLLSMPQELLEYPPQVVHCRLKDARRIMQGEHKKELSGISKVLRHCLGMTGIHVSFNPPSAPEAPFPVEITLKPRVNGLSLEYDISLDNFQGIAQDDVEKTYCRYERRLENISTIVNRYEFQDGGPMTSSVSNFSCSSSQQGPCTRSDSLNSCSSSKATHPFTSTNPEASIHPIKPSPTLINTCNLDASSSTHTIKPSPTLINTYNLDDSSSTHTIKPSPTPASSIEDLTLLPHHKPLSQSCHQKTEENHQTIPALQNSSQDDSDQDDSVMNIPRATFPRKSLDEKFLLKLTAVGKEPGEVYIILPSDELMAAEERIQTTLNACNWDDEIYSSTQVVKIGSCWAIKRKEIWHRVQVVGPGRTVNELAVQLVDLGGLDKARRPELKPLPPQLAEIPCHAHLCLLNGFTAELAEDTAVLKLLHQSTSAKNLYTGVLLSQQPGYLPVLDKLVSVTEPDEPTLIEKLNDKKSKATPRKEEPVNRTAPNQTREKKAGTPAAGSRPSSTQNNLGKAGTPAAGSRPTQNNLGRPPGNPAARQQTSNILPDEWDPLSEDFSKTTNNYNLQPDDPELAVIGYKSNEEKYICKFFAYEGSCHRERCPYQHIPMKSIELPTHDKDVVYELAHPAMPFPEEGSILIAMVSSVVSPWYFSLIFPYGTQEEFSGCLPRRQNQDSDNNLQELMAHLKNFYSASKPSALSGVRPAIGNLMVCGDGHGNWYRCKILQLESGNAKVNLIDFGSTEIFPLSALRLIAKDFIFMPPQCLQCQLAGVTPLWAEEGWSCAASKRFEELSSKSLLAVTFVDCTSQPLSVFLHRLSDGPLNIGEELQKEGLVRTCPILPTLPSRPRSDAYLPG